MEKKKHRSLEEILDSLKTAEKEFDEKLDKYGMKEVKQKKPEGEQSQEIASDNNQEGNADIAEETSSEQK